MSPKVAIALVISFFVHFALFCPLFVNSVERVYLGQALAGELVSFEVQSGPPKSAVARSAAKSLENSIDKTANKPTDKSVVSVTANDVQNTSDENSAIGATNSEGIQGSTFGSPKGSTEGIGELTEEPKLVKTPPNMRRTDEARKAGYTGVARILFQINAEGRVTEARMLNSLDYGLNERALNYVKQLVFKPAKIKETPVAVQREMTVTFKSQD